MNDLSERKEKKGKERERKGKGGKERERKGAWRVEHSLYFSLNLEE